MNDNEKYIEEFVNDIPFDAPNEKHRDELKKQLLNAFPKHRLQPTVHTAPIWRTIMRSRIPKLAAAAMIVIAVLAGLPFFSSNGSSVVLADVLERIEQTQAFMYRMKMTMTGAMMSGMPDGKKEMEGTFTISNDYGMKMEMTTTDANSGKEETTQQMYIIPDKRTAISLMPKQKKYMRMEFDDDLLARIKKQNNDPRVMIKQIMGCEYTELGRSVIDGIDVEGFRTTDPAFYAGAMEHVECTLWIDVEKWLPVRTEMDFKMNEQMQVQGVIYDFKWDIQVDASEFEPVIPEDFTAFSTEGMKMPSISEEGAVKGLKFFAEITGQYPKKLNLLNLMQEFSAIKNGKNLTDAGLKLKEEMDRVQKDEHMKKLTEMMSQVQSIGMFYMMLVQDKKEPAYYGEFIGPDNAEAVLMRWKVFEGRYRVIFGDLSALDVNTEELAELEKSMIDDGYKMPSVTEEAALEGTDESTAIDHYNRGEAHYFDGEYDQAFSELTKAIEIDPRLARAYETRGTAYNDKKEFDLAIADFNKVIELKPTAAHAYVSRGVAYGNKGQYDLAVADYSKAIEIDPTVSGAYECRARAYYYKGEYDKAWKDVYKAQALGQKFDSKLLEKLRKASGIDK